MILRQMTKIPPSVTGTEEDIPIVCLQQLLDFNFFFNNRVNSYRQMAAQYSVLVLFSA